MTIDLGGDHRSRYVFSIRFRLEPAADIRVDPAEFETTVVRPAVPPGEPGWRFFRDNLWRGELSAPDHFRELLVEALNVPVVDVSYRRFETTPDELAALEAVIADSLESFRADSVAEVRSKYFGGSIEVIR